MESRRLKKLTSAFLWLAFGLSLSLAGCQVVPPAATAAATSTVTPAATTAVENRAPAFTLPSSDGSTVSLSDYAGQPVLLYFHMANG